MATKKAAPKKAVKKAKKASATDSATGRGRTSAYAGKKITKLVELEATGIRATGNIRACWDAIKNGITVEKYRENCPDHGHARRVLADFIAKGYVKVS